MKGVYEADAYQQKARSLRTWRRYLLRYLGTGSGILSLLLLSGGVNATITGIEIQKEYCEIANKNASVNSFSDRFTAINGDIKDIRMYYESGAADVVFTNPPYLKSTCGKPNEAEHKNIAFHEVCCDINDICKSASWCLKVLCSLPPWTYGRFSNGAARKSFGAETADLCLSLCGKITLSVFSWS